MSFYRHSQSGSQYQNHPGPDQPGHFLVTKPLRFLHPSVMSNMLHSPRICIHASFAVVPLLLPSCGIIMRWLVRKAYRKSQLTLRFLFCLLLGSNDVVILLTLFQVFPARVFQAIRPLPLMLEVANLSEHCLLLCLSRRLMYRPLIMSGGRCSDRDDPSLMLHNYY